MPSPSPTTCSPPPSTHARHPYTRARCTRVRAHTHARTGARYTLRRRVRRTRRDSLLFVRAARRPCAVTGMFHEGRQGDSALFRRLTEMKNGSVCFSPVQRRRLRKLDIAVRAPPALCLVQLPPAPEPASLSGPRAPRPRNCASTLERPPVCLGRTRTPWPPRTSAEQINRWGGRGVGRNAAALGAVVLLSFHI